MVATTILPSTCIAICHRSLFVIFITLPFSLSTWTSLSLIHIPFVSLFPYTYTLSIYLLSPSLARSAHHELAALSTGKSAC